MKKRKKNRSSGAPTPFLLCMRGAILACILTAVLVLCSRFCSSGACCSRTAFAR